MALSKIDVANMLTGEVPNANVATIGVAKGGTGLTSGTSGQFLKFTGSTTLASASSGITQFHNWRYNTAVQNDLSPILSNWEENDSNAYERIGSALTYDTSTGYFTLPETGKYFVIFQGQCYHDADTGAVNFFVKGTTDNGSSSHTLSRVTATIEPSSGDAAGNGAVCGTTQGFFDCTDTSTHKLNFHIVFAGSPNGTINGDSSESSTGFTLIRIGDT